MQSVRWGKSNSYAGSLTPIHQAVTAGHQAKLLISQQFITTNCEMEPQFFVLWFHFNHITTN
jgi:hypothetical protein